MAISLLQSQAISELEVLLYGFAPGSHFMGIATSLGLSQFWQSGSKGPAISNLLRQTYEKRQDKFCPLITMIVEDAIAYGNRQGDPLRRASIEHLNEILLKLQYRIPELCDSAFLSTLFVERKVEEVPKRDMKVHLDRLMELLKLEPHPRGFAFEKFLYDLFGGNGLTPRGSFRLIGEQIDGSFEFKDQVYLLEAKWQNEKTGEDDLLVFSGKIGSRAEWARGLFISYAGFSEDGLIAFSKGKRTNIIGMTGDDLATILLGNKSLGDVLTKKIRIAAESGDFYYPVNMMQ
jgi:hypothetical protein